MSFSNWLAWIGLRSTQKGRNRRPKMKRPRTFTPRVERLEDLTLPSVDLLGAVSWTAAGPSPLVNGQTENIASTGPGADAVVGAIHTIITDPGNADIIFIGAVNGGVWRTTNATAANPTWTPLTDQFSGTAIGALAYDPTDATNNTVVAGIGRFSSFNGNGGLRTGILRTTDGGNTFASLGSVDLNGTNISGVAPRGATILVSSNGGTSPGVWLSINTGTSFTNISGSNGLSNGAASDLASDPTNQNRLYTAVLGVGIFRTDNLGGMWTNVSSGDASLNAAITAAGNNNLEMSVASNGRIYAGVIQNGRVNYIGFSDNQGGTWTEMDLPIALEGPVTITNASNTNPIVITAANHGLNDTNPHTVRIAGVTGNTAANGDFQINTATVTANTFTLLDLNGNPVAGNGAYVNDGGDFFRELTTLQPRENPGTQGGTHFSILADPNNANIVYVGGDRQDRPTGSPNSLGADDASGILFRGDTTVAAVAPGSTTNQFSPQWEHLTHTQNSGFVGGGTANDSSPHADSRDMAFDANGNLIEVDDGGIYRRTSPTDNTGVWVSLMSNAAGGLQVNEQHDIAYDNNSDIIFSGNQDTGTGMQTTTGSLEWTSISTADGGDVVVDNLVGGGNSLRYTSTQNLGGFRRRTFDAANTPGPVATPTLTLAAMGPVAQVAPQFKFVTPLAVNNEVANRLIIGAVNGAYESTDNGDNITRIFTGEVNGQNGATGSTGNAIAYGGAGNADVLYIGAGNQVFARTATTFGALTATAALPVGTGGAGLVHDVEMDPDDFMRVFAIDNNQVFFSPDAGATWAEITGNLNEVNLRTLEYVPSTTGGPDALLVGGNLGVYRLLLGQAVWTELGQNLPNAPVWDMDYDAADDILVVGTLGRGAWTISNASVVINAVPVLNVCGDELFPNQDDTFRLVRNAGNPTLLEVYINGVLEFSGPMGSIQQINVFGAGGNDTLIVDSTNGLILVPGGIRFDGDNGCPGQVGAGFGGFDTLRLEQIGGAVHTSDALAVGATNGSGRSTIVGIENALVVMQVVDFQFLEPVVDLVPAASLSITSIPALASLLQNANVINYVTGLLVGGAGHVTVDAFEPIEFLNKTNVIIDAGVGNDTVNLNNTATPAGLTLITVNAGDGEDTVTTLAGLPTPLTFNGGDGNDFLSAAGASGAATINGGTANDILIGGSAGDTLNGDAGEDILDGRGGSNALNGGIGVDTILVSGTAGPDTITTTHGVGTFNITGGLSAGTNTITSMQLVRVEADEGADDITLNLLTAGGLNYTVLGGNPIGAPGDILRVNSSETMTVTPGPENDAGSVDADTTTPTNVSYDEIELLIIGGGGGGVILGTNGDDAITIIARDSSTHPGADGEQDFTVSVNTGPEILFLNQPTLQVSALSGSDTIVLRTPAPNNAVWDVDVTIDGGPPSAGNPSGSDRVIVETPGAGAETVVYTPSASDGGIVDLTSLSSPVTLIGVEELLYDGEADNDLLTILATALADVITHTPGSGNQEGSLRVNDLLGLTYQNMGAGGSLTANGAGDSDTLVYFGTAANDAFSVAAGGQVSLNARLTLGTISVEALTLEGLSGDDTFTLVPAISASVYPTLNFNGGSHASARGDQANLTATGADDSIVVSGQVVSLGGVTMNGSGLENMNLNSGGGTDLLTYNGVAGVKEDIGIYGSTTTGMGQVKVPGVTQVTFVSTETIVVNGNLPDVDTLTFFGTNGIDRLEIDLAAAGTAGDPVLLLQNAAGSVTWLTFINYSGFDTLSVNVLEGNDVVNVYTAGTGPSRNLFVDGGLPTGKGKNTDKLNVFYTPKRPRIVHSAATQNPDSGVVTLDYGTAFFVVQYASMEVVTIQK